MNDMIQDDDVLRDMLVATINPDNTISFTDPDFGAVPVNMSYGDMKIVGQDGTELVFDGGNHPVVYTMTAPGVVEAFLVGREWKLLDQDFIDSFNDKAIDHPIGIRIS
jgi:hypothetical protein